MPDIENPGFGTLIDTIMRRYDETVRSNTTDVYDAVRAVILDSDKVSGVPVEVVEIARSVGAPADDRRFIAALRSAAEHYEASLRDELRAHLRTTTLAATDVELAAAETVAADIRQRPVVGVDQIKTYVRDHMAAQGLDALDLRAVARVAATFDLLLAPDVVTLDSDGNPLRCGDCGRRMVYDHRREAYRHLVDPERGCFLIRPDPQPEASWQRLSDVMTDHLDRLEQPPVDPQRSDPPPGTAREL